MKVTTNIGRDSTTAATAKIMGMLQKAIYMKTWAYLAKQSNLYDLIIRLHPPPLFDLSFFYK